MITNNSSKIIDLREFDSCILLLNFLLLLIDQYLNSVLSESDGLSQDDLLSFDSVIINNAFM